MKLNQIRLLHLIKSLDVGGIERSTINYSNHLVEEFGSVSIYASPGFYSDNRYINKKIPHIEPKNSIKLNPVAFLNNFIQLIKFIRINQINVINYHHRIFLPYSFLIGILFPRLKIIYTAHSVYNDQLNRFLFAHEFIAVSESVKKDLAISGKNKVTVIKHGTAIQYKGKKEDCSKQRTIGFIGRLVKEKQPIKLLETFRKYSFTDNDFRLVFVGEGPLENEIRKRISKYRLEEKVCLIKPLIDLNGIYGKIDILVYPSFSLEGFGLVIIEAQSFGIPVISFDNNSVREIITDGKNGILVRDGDFDKLLTSAELTLKDKSRYKELSDNAIRNVKDNFSLENTVDMNKQFFASL